MKFRAHDTFFIRKGWLSKGIKNIKENPEIFVSHKVNPMDILGIGANMVKALKYWLIAFRLTNQTSSNSRKQLLTSFGEILSNNDPYYEELGTLSLLHYQLVKDSTSQNTEATSWWYFFNVFNLKEFTKDDFVAQFNKYLRNNGEAEKPIRTLEDDFNCIINTYVSRTKLNSEKANPENNLECPLSELGLIDIVDKKNRIYKKTAPKLTVLHPLIVYAIILDKSDDKKELQISSLQNENGNIGKTFNLDIISLTTLLYKMELMEYIKVIRTAGLDVIRILSDWTFEQCINEYYKSING